MIVITPNLKANYKKANYNILKNMWGLNNLNKEKQSTVPMKVTGVRIKGLNGHVPIIFMRT